MPFLGTTPLQGFVSSVDKQSFTPNGILTSFTLNRPVANANDLEVFVGNVRQEPTAAYTASGTTLDFGSGNAPPNGVNLYVVYKGLAQVTTTPPDGSVSNAKITGMASSKLSGALPAIDGTALTGTGLGVGQTWTDTTSSRAFNTNYTNSTGKPIMVSFICTTGTGDNIQVVVGGVSFGDEYTNQSNGREMSSFIVPHNTVYRINGNTGSTTPVLVKWVELR